MAVCFLNGSSLAFSTSLLAKAVKKFISEKHDRLFYLDISSILFVLLSLVVSLLQGMQLAYLPILYVFCAGCYLLN